MTATPSDHQPQQPADPAAVPPEWADDADCLTPEQVAELARQEWELCAPDPDDPQYAEDPYYGPPEWYSAADEEQLLAEEDQRARNAVAEAFDAGFTHGAGGSGNGFAAGGPLDVMLPGSDLGWHLGQALRRPLDQYSDDELIGLLGATHREQSWAAAAGHKLTAELDRRRTAADGTPGEHVTSELAAALTLTTWSADALLSLARDLTRLPKTLDLLAAGIIDPRRAAVIARHTAVLSGQDAAKVENLILPRAGAMTTGELSSACLRAVIKVDPAAARKRKEKALKDARVEVWLEDSGTASIAGRDLPPADVITADKYIDAAARWLKANGVEGTHQQLCSDVFTCLLNGRPVESLLPDPAEGTTGAGTGTTDATSSTPATGSRPSAPAADPSTNPAPLAGTVHLTMPFDTWAGRSDNPGEIDGYGAADADTCRHIATRMTAGGSATRWCITLVDRHGQPAAHGCARAGPGPPVTTSDPGFWLATVTLHPIQATTCDHTRESAGYQPSNLLRHIVKTRSPRCGFPGCRRPAVRCDDDHTIPHHLGGRTCECNLYPLCRRHHKCKQAPGWHLEQPRPGQLIWTAPSGRMHTKTTEPHPV